MQNAMSAWQPSAHVPLNFQGNNNFELITAVLDIDKTIFQSATKLFNSMFGSYGAFTWSFLPFVSDVKSIGNTVKDLTGGIERSYDRLSGRFSSGSDFGFSQVIAGASFQFKGVGSTSGYVTSLGDSLPKGKDFLPIWLDELGFHPDLRTVWDAVPLSFLVDYVVPVGDYLESIHPRGWFNPSFTYDGCTSLSGNVTMHAYGGKSFYDVYTRSSVINGPAGSRKPNQPEWLWPSVEQLFNIGYIIRNYR
jgi:hypothetical protein